MQKAKHFTDLQVWKKSHALAINIYEITRNFPDSEKFGLVSQMRRAAVSITSNIAEGFLRISQKEKVQFYSVSRGSLSELQSQLFVARDIGFISLKDTENLLNISVEAHKMLNSLISSLKISSPNPIS